MSSITKNSKNMINRTLVKKIVDSFALRKIIVVYGARQVGKTTLLKQIAELSGGKILWFNGDEPDVREMFLNATSTKLKSLIGDYKFVFIDEAQRIKNIGLTLKLIYDNIPKVQVVATGSSSFDLFDEIKEPLTGRKLEFLLYPISYGEMVEHFGVVEAKRYLDSILKFGSYPEIVTDYSNAERLLPLIADSYLYKDLLSFEGIKKPNLLVKITQVLALQVGNEVSYNEIAQLVGADKTTVEKYIYLLEQTFVVFKLPALSRNMRNEIKKGKKIYFWDVGIRNAIISNFSEMNLRPDVGAIWENFIIAERLKFIRYHEINVKSYFWRNVNQKEVDYVEYNNKEYLAVEFKWNPLRKVKIPRSFLSNYTNSKTLLINPENFTEFLE